MLAAAGRNLRSVPVLRMTLHPGQFPVGSAVSRAAARALIDERRSQSKRRELVIIKDGLAAPKFGDWNEGDDGMFTRSSSIPAGMIYEEAERVAGLPPTRTDGDYLRLVISDRIRTQPSSRDVQPEW